MTTGPSLALKLRDHTYKLIDQGGYDIDPTAVCHHDHANQFDYTNNNDDWQGFIRKLDEFYPKVGDTLQLPLHGGVARLPAPDKK